MKKGVRRKKFIIDKIDSLFRFRLQTLRPVVLIKKLNKTIDFLYEKFIFSAVTLFLLSPLSNKPKK